MKTRPFDDEKTATRTNNTYRLFIISGYFVIEKFFNLMNSAISDLNNKTGKIIGCAIEVHRNPGPGLLESIYEACLSHEL